MKLIAGLGNPGKQYELTRHNIGFKIVEALADNLNATFKYNSKFNADLCEVLVGEEKVIIAKPQTFMNLSGSSISKIVNYYKIDKEDILICQDDLDLNFGRLVLKYNSSSGGQNGIKDIITALGTKEFLRLKFGIKNEFKKAANQFVLSDFNKEELARIGELLALTTHMLTDFCNGMSRLELMNKYN